MKLSQLIKIAQVKKRMIKTKFKYIVPLLIFVMLYKTSNAVKFGSFNEYISNDSLRSNNCDTFIGIKVCAFIDTSNKIVEIEILSGNDTLYLNKYFIIGYSRDQKGIFQLTIENGIFSSSMRTPINLRYIPPHNSEIFKIYYLKDTEKSIIESLKKNKPNGLILKCYILTNISEINYKKTSTGLRLDNSDYGHYLKLFFLDYYLGE